MKFAALAGLVFLLAASSQDSPPEPQREHELLRQFEGDWDVRVQLTPDPEKPPTDCSGRETARMGLGGFWLSIRYEGQIDGRSVEGAGTLGYDPLKRKYVGSWTESGSPHLYVMEGEADSSGKVFTLTGEFTDPVTRKAARERIVHTIREADKRTLSFYRYRDDGTEARIGQAEYTRRK